MSGKRHFVPPAGGQESYIEIKRRSIGVNPGQEYVEPSIYQERHIDYDQDQHPATDFSTWSEEEIKAFLDRRGEDFDDCPDHVALMRRAAECEETTGPATREPRGQQQGGGGGGCGAGAPGAQEEEDDPLEAFMAGISAEVAAADGGGDTGGGGGGGAGGGGGGGKPTKRRADIMEEPDHMEEFLEARKKKPSAAMVAAAAAAAAAAGYGSDDDVYAAAKAADAAAGVGGGAADEDEGGRGRAIESLAALDHEAVQYEEFSKDFYTEAPELHAMTPTQVASARREAGIRVSGFDPPKPISAFSQCGFDAPLAAAVRKAGYEVPTPIQAQALPAALSGRDVLGIAKTGSGKTAAFVLPMVVHCMDQRELEKGEGPIGVVVAPTRELSEQIHREARRFSKPYGLKVVAAFGGLPKQQQFRELKAGAEIAVCTPGRFIDLVKMKACTTHRVTYLVFDEADRMFDLGFEPQVRSILGQVRPDRQTLLFSATMPRKVERLVVDALTGPVRITVGEVGAANEDVKQTVEVHPDETSKQLWLLDSLPGFIDEGEVLVFANQRTKVEQLAAALQGAAIRAAAIHGDMDQHTRMQVLHDFKSGSHHVLVATDVAARGLDIKGLRTVINYEPAKDIDTHVHRVGRTGRAGDKDGRAVTLLLPSDARIAGDLVQSLTVANQEVPQALHSLAMKNPRFKKGAKGRGGGGGKGGGGAGNRRRPQVGGAGLGFGSSSGGGGGGDGGGALPQPPMPAAAAAAGGGGGGGPAPTPETKMGFAAAVEEDPYTVHGTLPPPPPVPNAAAAAAAAVAARLASGSCAGPSTAAAPRPTMSGFAPSSAPRLQQAAPSQPRPTMSGFAPSSAPQQQQQGAAAPGVAQPSGVGGGGGGGGAGGGGGGGGGVLRSLYQSQFKSSFVSSGTTGGDRDARPTIVMPKLQGSAATITPAPGAAAGGRQLPPPPKRVTEEPLYLSRGGGGGGGYGMQWRAPAAAAPPPDSGAVARAKAAAEAIAARLAAQHTASQASSFPTPQSAAAQAQAQAPWQQQHQEQQQPRNRWDKK